MNRIFFVTTLLSFLLFLPAKIFCQSANQSQGFTFKLEDDASTSAGIFKSDGALVRTLWGNEPMKAGTYTKAWDGKDDLGVTAPTGNYHVELIRSNVQYTWDGVIGNSSKKNSGAREDVDRWIAPLSDGFVLGNKLYFTTFWAEGNPTLWTKDINNIYKAFVPIRGNFVQSEITTQFCATDGTLIYWAGFDTQDQEFSWVYATKVSDGQDYTFPNGSPVQTTKQPTHYYHSAIDYREETVPARPRGYTSLTVQKNGNYLFTLRATQNLLRVFNKTSGALAQTISLTGATAIRTDLSNGLWVAFKNSITKYTVNSSTGAITATATIINTGLSKVTYMTINPDGSQLTVVDAGANQQVKSYNNTTGALVWTLGTQGGYLTNSDVTNFKFAFGAWPEIDNQNINALTDQSYPFLAYQPDGKLWVNDVSNARLIRYKADRTFDSSFTLQATPYVAQTHPTDPTRVFSGAYSGSLEWEIDYSKPLDNGVNGSWKLKRNWAAGLTTLYDKTNMFVKMLVQLPNGKVYGTLRNNLTNNEELFELVPNGTLRNTGVKGQGRWNIQPDGTLITARDIQPGFTYDWKRSPLLGFDASGNPDWGIGTMITFDNVPDAHKYMAIMKDDFDPWEATNTDISQVTTSGKQVTFDGTTEKGWHLGLIKLKTDGTLTTAFQTKTALSTRKNYLGDFPRDGRFDIGNNVIYSGADMKVMGNHIFWSYRGEFWKSVQTNYFNHFYENGLPVGHFGVGGHEATKFIQEGMAGNALNWNITKVDADNAYLYHGDESIHGGIHRWSIKNFSSIKVDTITLGSTLAVDAVEGIDLLAGLNSTYSLNDDFSVPTDPLQNGFAGWNRSPATNYYSHNEDKFTATIGTKSYDKSKTTDLFMNFRKPADYSVYYNTNNLNDIPTISSSVTRDLGNNTGVTAWKVTGKLNYEGIYEYNNGSDTRRGGGQFIEVLDNNGKIITRLYPKGINDGSNTTGLYGNETPIFILKTMPEFYQFMNVGRSFTISVNSTGASYKVADYPTIQTTIVDPTANWQNPKTLRFYFWTWNENKERTVGVRDLRFLAKIDTITTPNAPTLVADDAANTLTASHALGSSEILVSENGGAFAAYTAQINVGNVARAAGYWKFKTKAATLRNESAVVNSPAFTEVIATTPNAPTLAADDAANTLTASHALGSSEILVSENGGAFITYTGQINVGNVARTAGYWKFKTKAATLRNESAVVNSPVFTEVIATTPNAPTLVADDAANTLTASHALGSSEILVSENGGAFASYTGQINVGNVARAEGYWKFKTRAATLRNESAVVNSPAFTEVIATTPNAPTLAADDAANTLTASHALGSSEILVSENGGVFITYTGQINVGNVARAAGYWKFKTKAATQRNESAVVNSPAFTEVIATTPNAPTLVADDAANTLTASHALGSSEILVSENGGAFAAYTAQINVGNVARAAGYWKFKTKAATLRNESAVVNSPAFTEVIATTPNAPTLAADDAANTLTASHALGSSEILVSENGGAFITYTGQINVGNVARTAGYWKFKTKAATLRNESAVVNSPAFTEVIATTPNAPTLVADDAANTLTASHALGSSEILVSENGGAFASYTGQINVGNVARAEGYWKFKTRAATLRNESAVVNSPAFTEVIATTPNAPTLAADDAANTLTASHALGSSEILVSENGGVFITYTGQINVGNVARAAGYWKFKTKAATQRNESAVVNSPAFTEVIATTPNAPTLAANDNANTLTASHGLGDAEILVSENNGLFVTYTGKIDIGDVARPVGYWKFKTKATPQRNESPVANSPEFTIKKNTVSAPTIKTNSTQSSLIASNPLGDSVILVSQNNSSFLPYTGPITVSDLPKPAGYWKFKVKAGPDRNESTIASSPALLKDVSENQNIRVYPNPIISSNIFINSTNLTKGDYTVSLLNQMGQTIFKQAVIHPGGTFNFSIHVSENLPKGFYVLQISGKELVFSSQLLK